jgi:Transaldolase/Fructose-6-phosphate aldolase/Reverse transcriptase (RNA-dependent DNA polymerase)
LYNHRTTDVRSGPGNVLPDSSRIPNAYIKYSCTTEGLRAAEISVQRRIRVNMTLCFSQSQVAAVYAATRNTKMPVYVSPFAGCLDDSGYNGMDLIKNAKRMLAKSDGHAVVLAASIRSFDQLLYCPLLSNLYMRRFMLGWKKLGHEKRLAAYIVNYADDLVICCRGRAEEALAMMRDIITKLKLTVNETKTRVCKLPEEKFDFLGYTFGRCYSPKTGCAYIGTVPSKKRVIRICEAISEMTGREQTLLDQEMVVAKLNFPLPALGERFTMSPTGDCASAW